MEDERYVKAGDILARIDPKDYSVALANARADLAAAEAAFLSSTTDVPITSTTTTSQLKNARSGRDDAEAALLGAQRQLSAALARLDTAQAQVREAQSTYKNTVDDVARYKFLGSLRMKFRSSGTIPRYPYPIPQRRPSKRGEPPSSRPNRMSASRRALSIRPTRELCSRMPRSTPR